MPLLNTADALYRGTTPVDRVYLGSTLVWESAASGPLVSDSFDRPDSTTSLGIADTGQAWTSILRTFGISGNKAATTVADAAAHLDSGVADADITCDITHGGDNGLAFRSTGTSNFMVARLGANKVQAYRRQSGAYTLVGEAAMALTVGQAYAFRVACFGSTIDVYVDGVKKLTVTDSFQSTATAHGLYGSHFNGSRWDNFTVDTV